MATDRRLRIATVLAASAMLATSVGAPPASAALSTKKAIFGPVTTGGLLSAFPRYRRLGVGIYEYTMRWDRVARRRPRRPSDPRDRAYRWSRDLDYALSETRGTGMRIALTVVGGPGWANGHRSPACAGSPKNFAAFVTAAARRYPSIHLWRIWDDTNTKALWQTMLPETRDQPLTPDQQHAPRRYARLLDAAYKALKREDRHNLVIGGNTTTTGDISPLNWIASMRLPNGKPPHMDMYGHSPYGTRLPQLDGRAPLGHGFADFADLPILMTWVDRYLGRPGMRLFLAKYYVPTDHASAATGFWVARDEQARWIAQALADVRGTKRIYTLGWEMLEDESPTRAGDEVNGGLLTADGEPKPGYRAFRNG